MAFTMCQTWCKLLYIIISFHAQLSMITLIYQGTNGSSNRLHNLPKVTQLTNSWTKCQTPVFLLHEPVLITSTLHCLSGCLFSDCVTSSLEADGTAAQTIWYNLSVSPSDSFNKHYWSNLLWVRTCSVHWGQRQPVQWGRQILNNHNTVGRLVIVRTKRSRRYRCGHSNRMGTRNKASL